MQTPSGDFSDFGSQSVFNLLIIYYKVSNHLASASLRNLLIAVCIQGTALHLGHTNILNELCK